MSQSPWIQKLFGKSRSSARKSHGGRKKEQNRRRSSPRLENLEDRIAPASTFYVDNTNIGGPGAGAGMFTPNGGTQTPVSGLTLNTNLFTTIGAAVAAASPGDTIDVADGTYNEHVTINTPNLLIQGNQFGVDAQTRSTASESIVDGGGYVPFYVKASNVTINGFTIQDATFNGNAFPNLFGIELNQGTSGSNILNDIIQNNTIGIGLANNSNTTPTVISGDLIQNNNQPGPGSGAGIYSDPFVAGASASGTLTNVQITNNTFSGNTGDAGIDLSFTPTGSASSVTVSNNQFTGNARGLFLLGVTNSSITQNTFTGSTAAGTGDIRIFGGDSGLNIANNLLQNGAGDAIRIDDGVGSDPNSNISLNDNSISGYAGNGLNILNGYTGSLDASNNYWGSSTGPTSPNNPGGTGETIVDPNNQVTFSPYFTSGTNTASGRGFTPSGSPGGFVVYGTGANGDTLVLNATGSNTGTYTLNGGTAQTLPANLTRFSFVEPVGSGSNSFTIDEPATGAFAPSDGIGYAGGGAGTLDINGGSFTNVDYTSTAPTIGNNGNIKQDGEVITYTGLLPINDNSNAANRVFDYTGGSETITFGDDPTPNNNISRVSSSLGEMVDFATPTTSLTIDASVGTGPDTISLNQADLQFNTPTVTVNGTTSADIINVTGTRAGTTTTVHSGDGADTINVSSNAPITTGDLNSLDGRLNVDSGNAGRADVLNISESGLVTPDNNVVVDTGFQGGTITGAAGGGWTIGFPTGNDFRGGINLALGAGGNTVAVRSIFEPVTINTGGGADTVNIGSAANVVSNIPSALTGTLTVNMGGQAGDALNFNDQGNAAAQTYGVSATQITRTGIQPITYSGLGSGSLNLNGGTAGNTYNITATAAATTTINDGTAATSGGSQFSIQANGLSATNNINGFAGNDTFTVAGALAGGATLNIDGGLPTTYPGDTLNVPSGSFVTPNGVGSGVVGTTAGANNIVTGYTGIESVATTAGTFALNINTANFGEPDGGTPDTEELIRSGSQLQFYLDGTLEGSYNYASISTTSITGTSNNDTLTLDNSGGNAVTAGGLTFDGGTGLNTIIDQNGNFATGDSTPTGPHSGSVVYAGGTTGAATVNYLNLAPFTDSNVVGTFTVNGTAGGEPINIVDLPAGRRHRGQQQSSQHL